MTDDQIPSEFEDQAESAGALTKAELSELLHSQIGLNKREAKDVVDAFFAEIRETLMQGEGLKLTSFGNFQLRDKPQRPGRNPRTGEVVPVSARRVVTFHASQKLKAQVLSGHPSSTLSDDAHEDDV